MFSWVFMQDTSYLRFHIPSARNMSCLTRGNNMNEAHYCALLHSWEARRLDMVLAKCHPCLEYVHISVNAYRVESNGVQRQ